MTAWRYRRRSAIGAAATVAAIIAGGAPVPAIEAPAGEAPGFVGGVWAYPSCAEPEEVGIETRSFGLSRAADGRVSGYRYESFAPAASWVRTQTNRGVTFQREAAPGTLEVALYRGAQPLPAGAAPGDPPLGGEWQLRTYRRCDGLPSPLRLVHGEAAAGMQALDRIDQSCRGEPNDGCGTAVLAAMDVSGDGLLSVAELSRAARIALYLAAASEAIGGAEPIEEEALLGAQGAGVFIAPFIARSFLDSFDYDGDQRLSPAEMLHDRGAVGGIAAGELAAAPGQPEVLQALHELRDLGRLIEALMR